MYYLHHRSFRDKIKVGEEASTHAARILELDVAYDEAFDLVQQALPLLTIPPEKVGAGVLFGEKRLRLNKTAANRYRGVLLTWLRRRWRFYDTSRVTIHLEAIDAATTRISIFSQPALPFMIFDYGLNLHNVNVLAHHLREQAHLRQVESRLVTSDTSADVEEPTENMGEEAHHP
jgi:hypothetical protein